MNISVPKVVKDIVDIKVHDLAFMTFPVKQFDVIYADPPFNYTPTKRRNKGASHNVMPSVTLSSMRKVPVKLISKDNAILFMWSTGPEMYIAIQVMRAWGFTFKTIWKVWTRRDKNGQRAKGQGYFNRSTTEFLLLGTRGKVSSILTQCRKDEPSELACQPTVFNRKPQCIRHMISQMVKPDCEMIELFGQRCDIDWWSWSPYNPDFVYEAGTPIPVTHGCDRSLICNNDEADTTDEENDTELENGDTSDDSGQSDVEIPHNMPSSFQRLDESRIRKKQRDV